MKTSAKILNYLKSKRQADGNDLAHYLEISPRGVRKQLKNLLDKGKITKIGKPPKVFYLIKEETSKDETIEIDPEIEKIINERFLFVSPTGKREEGFEGFIHWCRKTKQPLQKTAKEYLKALEKYDFFRKKIYGNLIDGTDKIETTFQKSYLDKLFYVDFYSIERFGKTKLGQLLLYAKQSQNRTLMKELTKEVKIKINFILKKYKIDGVGFVPPTVKREIQFIRELEKNLSLKKRKISIVKVKTDIIVPQKTLNKLPDRVENAKKTFVVDENNEYKNILLIDDAVGSGATLNELASQMKTRKICRGKIIGLSITGSFKGFDVISEV